MFMLKSISSISHLLLQYSNYLKTLIIYEKLLIKNIKSQKV